LQPFENKQILTTIQKNKSGSVDSGLVVGEQDIMPQSFIVFKLILPPFIYVIIFWKKTI